MLIYLSNQKGSVVVEPRMGHFAVANKIYVLVHLDAQT